MITPAQYKKALKTLDKRLRPKDLKSLTERQLDAWAIAHHSCAKHHWKLLASLLEYSAERAYLTGKRRR